MGAFDRFPRVLKQIQELDATEEQALGEVVGQEPLDFIARFPPFDLSLSRYVSHQKRSKRKEPPLFGHVWAIRANEHYLVRHTAAQISVEHFAPENILTFELGEILLHDWMELEIQDGMQTRLAHMDFNAVGLKWIEPQVNALRVPSNNLFRYEAEPEAQIAQFPHKWQMLAHKHERDYGESPYTLLHEPTVSPRWLRRVGREGKLLLLMRQHLVLVREPLECYPYGWITKSCLRSNIKHASVTTTEQTTLLELTLGAHDFKWQIEMSRRQSDALQAIANELNTFATLAAA